jgi:hypothetical protein
VTRTVPTEVVELIDIFQQDVKREKPTSSGQGLMALHIVPIHEATIMTRKQLDKKAPEPTGGHLSQCSIPSPKSHSQLTPRQARSFLAPPHNHPIQLIISPTLLVFAFPFPPLIQATPSKQSCLPAFPRNSPVSPSHHAQPHSPSISSQATPYTIPPIPEEYQVNLNILY